MPKEVFDIRDFRGMVGSMDARDLPLGTAAYAENIDNIQQQGLFSGLPWDDQVGTSIYGKCQKVTPYDSGDVAVLVDRSASSDTQPTIRVVNISNMSQITYLDAGVGGRYERDCGASDGESVHVGMGASSTSKPKWVGNIFHGQFGGGAPGTTSISIVDAEIKRAECVGVHTVDENTRFRLPDYSVDETLRRTWDISQTNFKIGTTYVYFASLIYDGHQEAPLQTIAYMVLDRTNIKLTGRAPTGGAGTSTTELGTGVLINYDDTSPPDFSWLNAASESPPTLNEVPCDGINRVSFQIRIRTDAVSSLETLPTRVTGINIYRSALIGSFNSASIWSLSNGDVGLPDPEFLQHIKINDTGWADEVSGASATESFNLTGDTYATYAFVDELPGGLQTFENKTGYPSTLEHMKIHYGISCVAESYHVVGRAWHNDLLQIETWLFRSKAYRYDTFDWTRDYLVLPIEPNAIVYFGGKIYAFGNGRTVVINPVSFDIEDVWEGIGAPSSTSVIVTDRGMFFADSNNIYFHNGNNVSPIGGPVLRNQFTDNAAWLLRTSGDPVLVYDSRYDSIIVCYKNSATNAAALMFNISSESWSYVTFAVAGPIHTGFQTPNGRAYVSFQNASSPYFYSLFSSATKRAWKWVSPIIESIGEKTKFYKVRVAYKGSSPSIFFYDNDSTYTTAHAVTLGAAYQGNVKDGQLTTTTDAFITFREIALKVEGTASQDATHISLIHRRIGTR